MKNSISLININQDLNKDLVHKIRNRIKKKILLTGPWCKSNINLFEEDFTDTLILKKQFSIRKYTKNVNFLIKKYEFTLDFLIKKLNRIHNKKSKKKYWEILLGRWLMTWINHNYFIWDYIIEINKEININEFYQSKINYKTIIPKNTFDSHIKCKLDDTWREWTFEQVIKYQYPKKKINYVHSKKNTKILKSIDTESYFPKLIFLKESRKLFFYQFELDKKIKLQILKKFKFFFLQSKKQIIKFKKNKFDFRNNKNWGFEKNRVKCDFQKFLLQNLIYGIPKIFLENFDELIFYNSKVNWPKNSKYNITSYAQYYDELFKLYCAQKKESNKQFKLCIAQHGYGNFFQNDDFYNIYHDRKISDIYLTWGNCIKKKSKPLFYTKQLIERKIYKEYNKKKILFFSYSFHSGLHYPISSFENGNIINKKNLIQINNFINNLNIQIKRKIYFKNLNINKLQNFEKSLKLKIPTIKFVNKEINFLNVVNNHDIFIHHFLGTPFFECLMMNKPSIILFDKKIHFPLDANFQKFIKDFENLGILFKNEKKAAKFLNHNYDKIEKWWNGKKLQSTLKKFCKLFCYNPEDPNKIIKNIFK